MKTKLAIAACALFMSCASYAQTFDVPAGAPGYIENPSWDIKAGLPKIDQIIFTREKTQVFFETYSKGYAWCQIDKGTYIKCKPSGKVLKLLKADGIAIAPGQTYYRDSETPIYFNLTFPAFPQGTTSFDLIESATSDWKFYNVRNESMNTFAISSQDYVNPNGIGGAINIDELKEDNLRAGGKTSYSRNPEVVDNALVEVPATYPGGEAALMRFVSQNVVYPVSAWENNLQGTVIARFKVDVDGKVSSVKIEKSLSRDCDKAVVDVIRKLPRFVPAKQKGHSVPVWFRLPVRFRVASDVPALPD
ncbi:energy transducer TonB [Prevotellamassilia timonensis]|uniref:energy transducer TonB n=1 Tax=Prevotellamassilia timonensis TaxID=1852370 RepID=UPI003078057E